MRQPLPAGSTVEVLDALVQKVSGLESGVLAGRSFRVSELAGTLAAEAREAARLVLERLLQQAALVEPTRCSCGCGGTQASHGFESRTFTCRLGTVAVDRRRGECASCGASGHPFDIQWGLPDGHYGDDVREALERLAVRLTHREACDELEHLWDVAIGRSTSKRWCDQDGERAAEQARAIAEQSWSSYAQEQFAVAAGEHRQRERTAGFGAIEVDGVHVLTWKPGQEPHRPVGSDPKPAEQPAGASSVRDDVAAKREHRAPSTLSEIPDSPMGPRGRSPRVAGREVCVGLAYLDEHRAEESPDRGMLLERTYVTTLNDREGFWMNLHAAARAMGVLDRETLLRLSDGAAYFIDRSDELFQDQPLVGILDIQHARQHIWEAAPAVSRSPAERRAWVEPLLDLLDAGAITRLVERLRECREELSHKRREAIDQLIGYIERHQGLMDYPRYVAAGYPIASGGIESTNKRLVGRRCKQGGMIWSEAGLANMLALRTAFMNPGQWERLWSRAEAIREAA